MTWRNVHLLAGLATGLSLSWYLSEYHEPRRALVVVNGMVSGLEDMESKAFRALFSLTLLLLVVVTGALGWIVGGWLDRGGRTRDDQAAPGGPDDL